MPLIRSGHGLQEITTGVKLTLLTEVKLDREILIPEKTQQLTEKHLTLQTKHSTTLRVYGISNQIILKT
jgi:hypothetical protein